MADGVIGKRVQQCALDPPGQPEMQHYAVGAVIIVRARPVTCVRLMYKL